MSYELLRALAFAELAPAPALANALHASIVSGTPFVRILVKSGMIDRDLLDDFLARVDGPQQRTVTPLFEVASLLPTGMCERLLAIPVRRDPRTGTVDVAAVDLRDSHLQGEMEFHLKAPVRIVRASLAAIEDALARPARSQPPPATDRNGAYSVRGEGQLKAPRAASFPSEASIPVQASDSPFSAPPPPKYAPFAETVPRSTDSVNSFADLAPDSTTDPSRPFPPPSNRDLPPASSRGPNLVPASRTSKSAPPPPRRQVATPPWGTPQPKLEAPQPLEASLPTFHPHPHPQSSDPKPRGITQVPPPIEPMTFDIRGLPTVEDAIGRRHREPGVDVPPPHGLGTFRPPASTLDYVRRPSHVPLSGPGGDVAERAVVSFIPGPPPMNMRSSLASPSLYPEGGSVFAAMKLAEDRDLVLELLVSGARAVARRVALFVVKRGGFVGWTCTPEFSDRASLQTVMIPANVPSIFTTAMNEGSFLGAIRTDDVHAPLLRVMRTASRDVAISPVSVSGKTVLFLVADELGDTMIGTRRLDELTRACGDAFARIVRTRR